MTLADTSAWVEYIRDRDTTVANRLESLVAAERVATTEPVAMELLAGAGDERGARRLASMLGWALPIPLEGLADWELAAAVYRACRSQGFTPRSQLDCLIAAVAIREDVPILHADRDFDLIARHTPLRVVPV